MQIGDNPFSFKTAVYNSSLSDDDYQKNARRDVCTVINNTTLQCTQQALPVPSLNTISNSDYDGSYTVSWSGTYTDLYQLYERLNGGSWSLSYEGSAESKSFTGKGSGTWEYQVRSKNILGTSSYSSTRSVIVNTIPNTPQLSSPANGATLSNPTQTFTWIDKGDPDNKPSSTRQFELSIWNGSWNYSSGLITGTSKTVTLPSTGQYSWRVRAYDGKDYSNWSTTYSVGVANDPPNLPISLSPADNFGQLGHAVMLSWADGGDPDNYPNAYREYQAEIENLETGFLTQLDWTQNTSWTVTLPEDGCLYLACSGLGWRKPERLVQRPHYTRLHNRKKFCDFGQLCDAEGYR